MRDFICMGLSELCGIQAKIQNENICLKRDLNSNLLHQKQAH